MLDQAVDVLAFYKKLCVRSFGPNALNNLFVTATGQVALTSDGAETIKCLNQQHPVAKLIRDTLGGFHSKYGDGTKTLLFLIAETIAQIHRILPKSKRAQQNEKRRFVQALQHFQYKAFEDHILMHLKLDDYKLNPGNLTEDSLLLLKKLIVTKLNGSLKVNSCSHFADLLMELIKRNCSDETMLGDCLQSLYDHSHLIFVDQVGGMPWLSYFVDGIILQRPFHDLSPSSHLKDVTFSLIGLCFEIDDCDQNAVIKVTKNNSMTDVLFWKARLYSLLAEHWKKSGVNLVISIARVPDQLVLILAKLSIHVVHFCPEDDTERLAAVSECGIEYDLQELLTNGRIGHAESCNLISVSGKSCVHLSGILKQNIANFKRNDFTVPQLQELQNSNRGRHISGQIIILGPSAGSCQQTKALLSNTCKLLAASICNKQSTNTSDAVEKNTSQTVSVIQGGGAFEFAVHHFLSKRASITGDGSTSSLMKILAQSYLTIPLMLMQNSHKPSASKSSVIDVLSLFDKPKDIPFAPRGIDAQNGTRLLQRRNILEPLCLKIGQWHHLVMLVVQLLRLDTFVSVRGSLAKADRMCDEDSD